MTKTLPAKSTFKVFEPAKLAFKVFEPASGTDESKSPIIFFHGVTKSKEDWGNIPQVIADGTKRKAYAVDARNHGESEFTDVFSFDLNTDDLLNFMDIHKIPKAVLIGHSMGGIASVKMALKNPGRVEMIIIEDMYVKKFPNAFIGVMESFLHLLFISLQSIPKNLNKPEAIEHATDYLYNQLPHNEPDFFNKPGLRRVCGDIVQKSDGSWDVRFNRKIAESMNPETLMTEPQGEFQSPAYFIYGSLSSLSVGKEIEDIKKYFPKADFIEFEGASHEVHIEFPEKFSDTILQILKNEN